MVVGCGGSLGCQAARLLSWVGYHARPVFVASGMVHRRLFVYKGRAEVGPPRLNQGV